MIFLGIDPDLHSLAIASVGIGPVVRSLRVVNSKGSTERDAVVDMASALAKLQLPETPTVVVVEAQEVVYTARSGANPRDLINLAAVAGATVCKMKMLFPSASVWLTPPGTWKGQVPKQIHQARMFSKLGWPYEPRGSKIRTGYCRPLSYGSQEAPAGAEGLNISDWKHVGDAVGLALWGMEQWNKEMCKRSRTTA